MRYLSDLNAPAKAGIESNADATAITVASDGTVTISENLIVNGVVSGVGSGLTNIGGGGGAMPIGNESFTTPGTFQWTCPAGVTSISAVCIGGGGGSTSYTSGTYAMNGGCGGGLGWKNSIPVVPGTDYNIVVGAGGVGNAYNSSGLVGGNSYFIDVNTVSGRGGIGGTYNTSYATGGTFTGDGGGDGGGIESSGNSGYGPSGGGGAGGYNGNGGKGIDSSQNNSVASAYSNSGGAAGGGNNSLDRGYGGGGVGLFGIGTTGVGIASGLGHSGSGGSDGYGTGIGGEYGAGAGGSTQAAHRTGTNGAVRLMWGTNKSFPSNATAI